MLMAVFDSTKKLYIVMELVRARAYVRKRMHGRVCERDFDDLYFTIHLIIFLLF